MTQSVALREPASLRRPVDRRRRTLARTTQAGVDQTPQGWALPRNAPTAQRRNTHHSGCAGPQLYFAEFRRWHRAERRAMQFVRGRVLDVGLRRRSCR
jgi:hypothetical protein